MANKWLILVLLIATAWVAHAQTPYFRNQNLIKGKENYSVQAIFQDSLGYLWMGTSSGLIRMGGGQNRHYKQNEGLAGSVVTAITADKHNNLYFGHSNGQISQWQNDSLRIFKHPDYQNQEKITALHFDPNGHLWVGTLGGGAYRILPDTVIQYNSFNRLNDDYVYTFAEDASGNIWIGTDSGIAIWNGGDFSFLSMKDGLPDNIVKKLAFSTPNQLLIGMEAAGMAKYHLGNKQFESLGNWQWGRLNTFVRLWDNEFWISTQKQGIVRMTLSGAKNSYRVFSRDDGIISNTTYTIAADTEGNLWIGGEGGVSQYTGNQVEFINDFEELPFRQVIDFSIDNRGRYWVTSQQGLFVLEPNQQNRFDVTPLLHEEQYQHHTFLSLYKDPSGYMWVSTYGFGVYRIHPEDFTATHFSTEDGLTNDNVMHISGSDSAIWLATLGGGANKISLNKNAPVKSITTETGLASNYLYATYTDSRQRVWFAQDGGGLAYLGNGEVAQYDSTDGLFSQVIYGITEARDGSIWCTTADEGVYRFKNDTFRHYTTSEGLISNEVNALHRSEKGDVIFVSNLGISIFSNKDHQFISYGEDFGLAYWEPNINGIFRDSSNAFWIATNKGILKYNYGTRKHEAHPSVFITQILQLYKEIQSQNVTLNYDENHLIFAYQGIWYQSPQKLRYRYRLKGQNAEWSPPTQSKRVTYSNLAPGDYEFQAQASVEAGEWVGSPKARFQFTVKPPIWQRWWFIALAAFLVLLAIFLIFRIRTNKLRKDKEHLEQEVLKRTNEIRQQNEELQAQSDEIKEKNNSITQSIVYASRIQSAVLPPLKQFQEVFTDHFVFFKPRDIVSGDFYWITSRNGYYVFAVADSTGHGVPGAFLSMMGITFLNEIMSHLTLPNMQANEILHQLRDKVIESLHQSENATAKDGMDIALCLYNPETNQLQFAGANNPLILMRNNKIIPYKGDRMPIGTYSSKISPFTNHLVTVEPEDRFYMYSDGFQDQFGGPKKRKFLARRFKKLLYSQHHLPFQQQKEKLDASLKQWQGNNNQIDDILVMGFRLKTKE